MKRNKGLVVGVAALAVGVCASVYFSPYWTLYRIKAAIARKDTQALAQHVDFPALRDSTRRQVDAALRAPLKAMADQMKWIGAPEGAIDRIVDAVPTRMVGQLAGSVLSPATLSMLLSGQEREDGDAAGDGGSGDKTSDNAGDSARKPADFSLRYRGWNEALIVRRTADNARGFVFEREGLWSWKLSGIALDLPPP